MLIGIYATCDIQATPTWLVRTDVLTRFPYNGHSRTVVSGASFNGAVTLSRLLSPRIVIRRRIVVIIVIRRGTALPD